MSAVTDSKISSSLPPIQFSKETGRLTIGVREYKVNILIDGKWVSAADYLRKGTAEPAKVNALFQQLVGVIAASDLSHLKNAEYYDNGSYTYETDGGVSTKGQGVKEVFQNAIQELYTQLGISVPPKLGVKVESVEKAPDKTDPASVVPAISQKKTDHSIKNERDIRRKEMKKFDEEQRLSQEKSTRAQKFAALQIENLEEDVAKAQDQKEVKESVQKEEDVEDQEYEVGDDNVSSVHESDIDDDDLPESIPDKIGFSKWLPSWLGGK